MAQKKKSELRDAIDQLRHTLKFYDKSGSDEPAAFLAVAKAFEVAVEYAWKELKRRVDDEGLDAASPKEAVRQSARLGIIDNAERWLEYINARNSSVHDYFGMTQSEYVKIAREFVNEVHGLKFQKWNHQ